MLPWSNGMDFRFSAERCLFKSGREYSMARWQSLVDCVRLESGMSNMAHGFKSHPCRLWRVSGLVEGSALNTDGLKGLAGSSPVRVAFKFYLFCIYSVIILYLCRIARTVIGSLGKRKPANLQRTFDSFIRRFMAWWQNWQMHSPAKRGSLFRNVRSRLTHAV